MNVFKEILILFFFLSFFNNYQAQTRYWVGGTGSWTNTARWSSASGGAGGASIPVSTNDVVFDALSGSGTITMPTGATNLAQNVTFSATTSMSVITGPGRLDVTGNFTLRPNMTLAGWTGFLYFYTPASVVVTRTITTANNTFANFKIQFELPSVGVGGNAIINGDFTHQTGTEVVNLQSVSNFVTFNNACIYSSLQIGVGTVNTMTGFTAGVPTADVLVPISTAAFNSFGNGTARYFYISGNTNLNAGGTVAGNTYTFATLENSSNITTFTNSLTITNCTINIGTNNPLYSSYWKYGDLCATARVLNASGSLIRFLGTATSFWPQIFTFNDVVCDESPTNLTFLWQLNKYYVTPAHPIQPNFNSVTLDRNVNFSLNNVSVPTTVLFPTFNTLLKFTPGHAYNYSSANGELMGSRCRFVIPNGATLDMQGLCEKPIWLSKMAFEFGATSTILSDNIRLIGAGALAQDNAGAYSICSPVKAMGAGSYKVDAGTTFAGWDIDNTKPTHRNLVWVGPYNSTAPSTLTISPTLPLTTFNTNNTGLVFTVNNTVTLKSVDVYASNIGASAIGFVSNISNALGVVTSINTTVNSGASGQLFTLNFNTVLSPGTYTMSRAVVSGNLLLRTNVPQSFPIQLSTGTTASVITISNGLPTVTNYYNYYNWQFENFDLAGTNNWYDSNNWRDVTSIPAWTGNPLIAPGNPSLSPTCPPTYRDSVIFPNNSFVNCDKPYEYCEGVNWQGAGRIYSTAEKEMEVWGSLFLSPTMQNDFKGTHWFKSDRPYQCWITTNNQPFDLGLVFASNNGNGTWLLKDSLIARNEDVGMGGAFASSFISGGFSFLLNAGHLHTGTAICTPGNGQTIEMFGMHLAGGKISLYDSDVYNYGQAGAGSYVWNFATNTAANVKINAGTSNIIFSDKYNPGGNSITAGAPNLSMAYIGTGHRFHEITLRKPITGSYPDYTNALYINLDTIAKITCEPGTVPMIGTVMRPASVTPSMLIKNGGLIRRLDIQGNTTSGIQAYQYNFFYNGIYDNTYQITIDSLTSNAGINIGENINIRSYLKFAPGKSYFLGSTPTGTSAVSINLMGVSTLTYNPYNCVAPTALSYTNATADITGDCINNINITNGGFIANTTASINLAYANIVDNTVTGPTAPFNFVNSNLTGTTTGWNGIAETPRKLRWKDVSTVALNTGNWTDPNYWELVSGGTGTQTIIAPAPQCPPTKVDTALFDNPSFTANNQIVNLPNILTEIGSIYWRNITLGTNPTFTTTANINALNVYASLVFHKNMQQNFSGPVLFRGAPAFGPSTFSISTITCGDKPFNNKVSFLSDGNNKVWSLQDTLTALNNSAIINIFTNTGTFNLIKGEFITNGYPMYLGTFNSNSTLNRKINISNSKITVNNNALLNAWQQTGNSWIVAGTASAFSITATGSTINFTNPTQQGMLGGGKKYNNINFKNFSIIAGIYSGGNNAASFLIPNINRDTFNIVTFTAVGAGGAFLGYSSGGWLGQPFVNDFSKYTKVVSNAPLKIESSDNEFDTLIMNDIATIRTNNKYNNYVKFTPGKTYNMASNSVQWFKNRCQVDLFGFSGSNVQLYSTNTGSQAYFRKDTGFFCTDFINMRDIWAIGNGNNPAACASYTNAGPINTNCTPVAGILSHAVSSCDTITDIASTCGPWDGVNFTRGRADFNAGVSADLQDNDFGWSKRGYPPTPSFTLSTISQTVCSGNSVVLSIKGIANPPFSFFYTANGVNVNQSIPTVVELTSYTASTGAFTQTIAVTPTVNTSYNLGFITISRCFNPQSVTGTGTVNVSVAPLPSVILSSSSPTTICENTSFNLNASATSSKSYSLFPTATGTANPTSMVNYTISSVISGSLSIPANTYTTGNTPTTYTVYAASTSSLGCIALARTPIEITINPLPQVMGVPTNVACYGNNTGAVNYTITGGSGAGYIISPSTVSNLSAGVYNYTVTDSNGCKTNTTTTITQPASALSSITTNTANTSCVNPNGVISATPSGGTSTYNYLWNNGSSSQTNNNLSGGTYKVIITDANACTYTAQTTVSNPPSPTITAIASSTNICNGETVTITPNGGNSYTLVPSTGSDIVTTTNAAVTPTKTTSYTVYGSNATTGCANSVVTSISVGNCFLPIELINFTAMCHQGNVVLNWTTASETNNILFEIEESGDGITWNKIGQIAGANNSATTKHYAFTHFNKADKYIYFRLKQIDADELFTYSNTIDLLSCFVNTDFSIYPNPNNGEFTIQLKSLSVVSIIDVLGRELMNNILENGTHQIKLNEASGVYLVKIITAEKQKTQRLIIN